MRFGSRERVVRLTPAGIVTGKPSECCTVLLATEIPMAAHSYSIESSDGATAAYVVAGLALLLDDSATCTQAAQKSIQATVRYLRVATVDSLAVTGVC